MPRGQRRVREPGAQGTRMAALERQLHDVEAQLAEVTQQRDRQQVAFRERFKADGQQIRESRARITESSSRILELEG